jgi:uncharacterized protein YndB with AHSA1/START domain
VRPARVFEATTTIASELKEYEMTSNVRTDDLIMGSLQAADGVGIVRIEGRFDCEVDELWAALTDIERLAHWYGDVEGELRAGGAYSARLHATGWEGTGRVEECEPPRRLLVVSKGASEPNEVTTEVTLTSDGDQTVLVVEKRGLPLDLLWAYGAGNQIHVEDLGEHIAGRERVDTKARFAELEPAYRDMAAGL